MFLCPVWLQVREFALSVTFSLPFSTVFLLVSQKIKPKKKKERKRKHWDVHIAGESWKLWASLIWATHPYNTADTLKLNPFLTVVSLWDTELSLWKKNPSNPLHHDTLQHLSRHSPTRSHLVSEERRDPTMLQICRPVSLETVNKLTEARSLNPLLNAKYAHWMKHIFYVRREYVQVRTK